MQNPMHCGCDPALAYEFLRKTPNVKKYRADHSFRLVDDNDVSTFWSGRCKLNGEGVRSKFRVWWMSRLAFVRASETRYILGDDDEEP